MLPFFVRGQVVHGFGRGGRQLGFPTANLADDVVHSLPPELINGVYYGWASVGKKSSEVFPAVMSLGWNPHFSNKKRSLEVHILHKFEGDFYDDQLNVCLSGYIREQEKYSNLGKLSGDIITRKVMLNSFCR